MSNTLGKLYQACADLQDADIKRATLLIFADVDGVTNRVTVKQLAQILKEEK